MTVKEVLDHKWITGGDEHIRNLRRKSQDLDDKVLEFVSYSNVDLNAIQQNSPRSALRNNNFVEA